MMTEEIFEFITTITRGNPESASCRAARAVLLEGMSQAAAVGKFNISINTVAKSVRRYRLTEMQGRKAFLGK